MTPAERPPVCRQVWERAVESTSGVDVTTDAAFADHVGSCVTCFRTIAELRDVPRLAAALHAAAPAVDVPDRFWDDLAARTTGAAAAALTTGTRKRRVFRMSGFATAVAAMAAAWMLFAGRGHVVPPVLGPAMTPHPAATAVNPDEDEGAEAVDVADLDESALRRLLDRLRARAPANVAALATVGDSQDLADAALDDDGVSDELANLDGPALLRVARSLGGTAL